MSAVKMRWIAALLLVLVHVQGIQYDTCNGIPTSFSPKCDLGKKYTLDDFQGQIFSACRIKECPTSLMKSYDPFLASVIPEPFVTVNHIVNFTCSVGYRMADHWFTFLTELDAGRPRSSMKNCTSIDRCELERPPKCLPVRCATTQFKNVTAACRDCSKNCSATAVNGVCPPENAARGIAYFVFGNDAHTITMKCPPGKFVQGACDSDEFQVKCQDSGQISKGECVQRGECINSGVRRDSASIHDGNSGKMLRKSPTMEEDQAVSKLLAEAADGCKYVLPALTKVTSEGWTAQRLYAAGEVVQIACTAGNAFFNQTSFSVIKSLTCANNGSWIEQNLVSRTCVKTCSVPYSNHDQSRAVTVGTAVTARCKAGYRVVANSQGRSFSQCTNSQTLQASCQQTSPAGSARLDSECMKVTCGTFKAYPLSEVTIFPAQNSRFSDFEDENGNEAERTRVDCGTCFRANDANDRGVRYYYRKCLDTCQFDLPSWNCTRLRCNNYVPPPHATIVSPANWNTEAQLYCGTTQLIVACDTGYVRKGSPAGTCQTSFMVTCNNDRQLVNENEECVRPFCAPIADPFWAGRLTVHAASFSPANGVETVPPGTTVSVTCAEGYRGIDVAEATCSDPRTFTALCTNACVYDSSNYFCVPVVCNLRDESSIIFDISKRSPFLDYLETFQASCKTGYRIGTHDPAAPQVGELACGADCGITPVCKPVTCGSYLPPYHSSLSTPRGVTATAQEVFYDEILRVQCAEGYVVEGTTAPTCATFFDLMCDEHGNLAWTGTGRCMPRICDCPGDGECITRRISCGQYTEPSFSEILPSSQWSVARDYAFGEMVQLTCIEGYSVSPQFPGRDASQGNCGKKFVDECISVGRFRSSFEMPCQRITCPTPAMPGLIRNVGGSEADFVDYGSRVVQTCEGGYEPIDQDGQYVLFLPYESTCQDSCLMSRPLTCTFMQCGMYGKFDYSLGVHPAEAQVAYGSDLQIVCKDNYMLDDRPFCQNALQTAADGCIPITIKGLTAALSAATVLGNTLYPPPTNVRLPQSYAVSACLRSGVEGDTVCEEYGSVKVTVPPGGWPSAETERGVTITILDIPAELRPGGLKSLAGPGVKFGPNGLQFLAAVGLALPFSCPGTGSCEAQYAGKSIVPHRLQNDKWVPIDYAAGAAATPGPQVDYVQGIVQGQTMSFSTYAAIAVVNVNVPPSSPGQGGGGGGGGGGTGGGGGGGVGPVEAGGTTIPPTTTPAPIVSEIGGIGGIQNDTERVEKSECMPCPAKPAFSIWTGIIPCDFECVNGTQQIESRCEPCPNAWVPNSSWLGACEWTCAR